MALVVDKDNIIKFKEKLKAVLVTKEEGQQWALDMIHYFYT